MIKGSYRLSAITSQLLGKKLSSVKLTADR
jgi:hypothetical protein